MTRPALKNFRIHSAWCKGCGICVAFCPKQVLELDSRAKAVAVRIGDCIACGLCERMCPDLAIMVELDHAPAGRAESEKVDTR